MIKETMKAAVLYAPSDLRIEEVPVPKLSKGWALVRVKACGICGSDLARIMKTGTYHFPTIPGHEFAGEIAAVPEDEKNWKAGDRVVIAPLIPCGKCESCKDGHFGQCDSYDFLGSRRDGAFAEYVAAPVANLLPLPAKVSFEEGAMVEPSAVTIHGMFKMNITENDTVAVLGVGAVGLVAVAVSKIVGAKRIYAVDIAEDKLEMAKQYGAGICINSLKEDPVAAIDKMTDGHGVSVVVEAAGSAITQEQSLRMAKSHARILFLGTAHRMVEFPPESFERIIRRELVLFGSWNSYSGDFPGKEWRSIIDYANSGRLDLKPMITRAIPLGELPATIKAMTERKFDYNKVLVVM
jgi:L-iditol 2-dehydrogenase